MINPDLEISLTEEDYKKVVMVLEQAILATDLASYFEKREKFQTAADMGEIDWQAEDKKKLLYFVQRNKNICNVIFLNDTCR